ncbi:hypothetical protein Patl1_12578 [Pistacia atlantica]|uniref:Uncharacterized protein n=1 Tax=Pistacia atlantica TaxID=434234 RepID=A0ACC1AXN8_9ROSI|nr:hypothetical protein Patl1_12578 [Pistacia atlantica]
MLELDKLGFSLWLSSKPSKRWGELTLCLGKVVPYKLYESFTGIGVFASGFGFSGSFFLDINASYRKGEYFSVIFSVPCNGAIDGKPGDVWDLPRVAVDGLGAAMLVTILLDLWQIFLGPIVPLTDTKQCLQPGLP